MLLNINNQIELNYIFQHEIFYDDIEFDVDDIIDVIKNTINKYNDDIDDDLLKYDDIFLNVEFDNTLKKFIKFKTNLLNKILCYKNDELINISLIYDPLNHYDENVDVEYIVDILNEYLYQLNYDKFDEFNEIEIINNNEFDDLYKFKYSNMNLIYNKYDIIELFYDYIDDIIDIFINDVEIELNKTYNKL